MRAAVAISLLLLLAACAAPADAPPRVEPDAASPSLPAAQRYAFEEVHFGAIPVELVLYAPSASQAHRAATAAFARIAALSAMMNDYAFEPPSLLNRIAAEAPAAVEVPPELLAALQRAIELHAITAGAFDITAKPFVQLWRVSQRLGELPPAASVRRAHRFVDITALELDPAAATARLTREGMWLDLGGIAKGLIGDEVVRLLGAIGLPSCRYTAGGDMVFGDAPPGEEGWAVTVPDFPVPSEQAGELAGEQPGSLTFTINNAAASVSGDVFRFFEIDGVRYAHVIDPRTGLGVTERRITCVRGPRGVDTDALATAGLILDDKAWRAALAKVPGCRGDVAHVRDR